MAVTTATCGFQAVARAGDLGTSDRGQAEKLGRELLSALLPEGDVVESGALSLAYLCELMSGSAVCLDALLGRLAQAQVPCARAAV